MRPRRSGSKQLACGAAALSITAAMLLFGAQAALAGVGGSVVPQLQSPVVVSTTTVYSGNIVITNQNTSPESGDTDTVSGITFTPSCGAISDPCSVNDPGVISIVGNGTGTGACAGVTFTFGPPDPTTGQVTVTPSATVSLAPGAACTISFGFKVNKLPKSVPGQPQFTTEQVGSAIFTDTSNQQPGAASGTGFTTIPDAAPTCGAVTIITGPPKKAQISVQETNSGIKSIVVNSTTNATVSVPAFTQGTTSPVTVTGTKTNQALGSKFSITVTDVAGQSTTCDPALVTVHPRRAGRAVVRGVAQSERFVSLVNGSPGLRSLTVYVNGQRAKKLHGLRQGERRTVDISRALHRGTHNKVVLSGAGPRSSSADLLIADSK